MKKKPTPYSPVEEIFSKFSLEKTNTGFAIWLHKNKEKLLDKEKRLKACVDIALSIGYDAGYENGKKPTAPKNTEAPQARD